MSFFKKKESDNKKKLDEVTKLLVEDEKHFHDIFDQSAAGESIVGLDGRWLDVNDRLCKMLGYSRKEMLSKNFSDVTYPDDIGKSKKVRQDIIEGKISGAEFEKRYIKKDGTVVWVLLSISLFRNHDHKPHYFITHTQDITSFKKIENRKASNGGFN
jgi:PAS domain S-box-containing protein